MSNRTEKFPTSVFVAREDDGDGGTFLVVYDNLDNIGHGEIVAHYDLRSTQVLKVTRTLENRA